MVTEICCNLSAIPQQFENLACLMRCHFVRWAQWDKRKSLLNNRLEVEYHTVKDSDLNFFWAPKLSAGGLNFGLDSQYGNWNISSLNSPLRGILYSMVWRCNLRVVKVNIAFSCRSFMVRHLMFRFGLKLIMANLFFMFNHMIVCVCQEHKP